MPHPIWMGAGGGGRFFEFLNKFRIRILILLYVAAPYEGVGVVFFRWNWNLSFTWPDYFDLSGYWWLSDSDSGEMIFFKMLVSFVNNVYLKQMRDPVWLGEKVWCCICVSRCVDACVHVFHGYALGPIPKLDNNVCNNTPKWWDEDGKTIGEWMKERIWDEKRMEG